MRSARDQVLPPSHPMDRVPERQRGGPGDRRGAVGASFRPQGAGTARSRRTSPAARARGRSRADRRRSERDPEESSARGPPFLVRRAVGGAALEERPVDGPAYRRAVREAPRSSAEDQGDELARYAGDARWPRSSCSTSSAATSSAGTPRAFEADVAGAGAVEGGDGAGLGRGLRRRHWQAFFLMPLMHSENMAHQERSRHRVPATRSPATTAFAIHHRDQIKRFGRFPGRNRALGRQSG